MFEDKYPGIALALTSILDITLKLPKSLFAMSKKSVGKTPPVLDITSSMLKQFVKSLERAYGDFTK
ncbi:MAG: hypothetical protein B7O98_01665 [Zestosphaera tikiterensis]|uniref:Uncharacterized protein n=1 Tax=Zestosphaera tikiterensis TaxID=1973259 RepID=A0A2R7Y6L1_9CREN|nr:MAG: hypothetical protein B7O98_01665 [Zestosphaera tikiterensis]